MEVTRVEQCAYIKMTVLRGRNVMKCNSELAEALGNNALPYLAVARWVGKFQQGRVSTSDEQRSRRPVTVRKNWSTWRTLPTFRPVTLILFPRLRNQYMVGSLQHDKTLLMLGANSDEAHFWLNGYVNKQNYRIWSEANPQVYVKTPLHPEKLTVWCALWAGGVLQKR
ncbi:HTH_48 domain-containing protein [Trichonephila clavipes]|nr:HTH_48 domain-containing protein [Trichonephila clavipes]